MLIIALFFTAVATVASLGEGPYYLEAFGSKGVLTALPANQAPIPGQVKLEKLHFGDLSQKWKVIPSLNKYRLSSKQNSINQASVTMPSRFSYQTFQLYTIKDSKSTPGAKLFETQILGATKCLNSNGISQPATFGSCDTTPKSNSHWRLIKA